MTPSSNTQQTGSSWDPDRNTGLAFGPPDQAERSHINAGRTPYTLRGRDYHLNNVGDEDLQVTLAAELDQLDGDALLATGQKEYLEQRERCFTGLELDAERDPGRWPVRPPYGIRRYTNASRATKANERAKPSTPQAKRLPREDLSEKPSKADDARGEEEEERKRDESNQVSMIKQ
ncbi:hypothetical protein LTR56_017227 [Elasticomyces elasticus]|nr:hypothetical protein LTR56_017227 [Elasticomyces elasticus]KAK4923344.1 hypothetical protein LTR49_009414 [Elasticomyces elasticus]KAK5751154.1 hypothetical protein LTS12_018788 [Elasticomyces elasticus]